MAKDAIVVCAKSGTRWPWVRLDGRWSRPYRVHIGFPGLTIPTSDFGTPVADQMSDDYVVGLSIQEMPSGYWWDVFSSGKLTTHHRRDVLVWRLAKRTATS